VALSHWCAREISCRLQHASLACKNEILITLMPELYSTAPTMRRVHASTSSLGVWLAALLTQVA
jgi:hypothetical protein